VQREGDVSGNFSQQGPIFLPYGKMGGDGGRQQAIDLPAVFQPDSHRPPATILLRQCTVGAGGGRGLGHHDLRLSQRPPAANGQLATLQLLDQGQELLAQTGFGGHHKPFDSAQDRHSGLIHQSDPGVMIAASPDEAIASATEQPVTVLFLGDELVDVSDSTQHGVEVFYPFLHPLALGDILPLGYGGGDRRAVCGV
jgi:hypothetical protein